MCENIDHHDEEDDDDDDDDIYFLTLSKYSQDLNKSQLFKMMKIIKRESSLME